MLTDFLGFGNLLVADVTAGGVGAARGFEIRLAAGFGTHGKPREQLFEILALAGRAPRQRVVEQEQLEPFPALAAFVLVDRHRLAENYLNKRS
jgi:hypothetical protein